MRSSQPELFDYDELLRLDEEPRDPALQAKLDQLRNTAFVNNEAWLSGARPHAPSEPGLGKMLRVVQWNIERGIRLPEIIDALTDSDAFLKRQRTTGERIDATELLDELDTLHSADVFVFNEVDWGLKRSEYREVVRELGKALKMNWAYGVEFVEVDPLQLGTETFEGIKDEQERQKMIAAVQVDRSRLRALHGTAVLSRYPIREARVKPFETVGYDWHTKEVDGFSKIEEGKRFAAEKVFLETVRREIRLGGRTCLYITLDVPSLPRGALTVVAPHLENRAKPVKRKEQMDEVLAQIKSIAHPILLAGDFNTTGDDTTPTSIKREVYQRLGSSRFWADTAIKYATGLGLVYDVVSGGVNMVKNLNDPTAKDVPLVAPNAEYELFRTLEEVRFDDGATFDFRGDKDRTLNGSTGTLGNSNYRLKKGFKPTYSVERSLATVGRLKLDWILVKSYIESPRDSTQTYRFAPHYPRTMEAVNYALEERLSDHCPISADLPFEEPGKLQSNKKLKLWPF
ncbi:MAG: endonuclease/exonuclease/phosphatase family protein [Bryobacterales bacterium]|nr:endonuclease/exonuclease/phosphatase family protein [Acidobacteriota bacterium]MCB9385302.1 endonuclease/exonuclease/phosphatase family protein [Bryobacterales bacterium]